MAASKKTIEHIPASLSFHAATPLSYIKSNINLQASGSGTQETHESLYTNCERSVLEETKKQRQDPLYVLYEKCVEL